MLWVSRMISTSKKPEPLLHKFIKIAFILTKIHNYEGAMKIYQALHLPWVASLEKCWMNLPDDVKNQWIEVESILDSSNNYSNYEQRFNDVSACTIVISFMAVPGCSKH